MSDIKMTESLLSDGLTSLESDASISVVESLEESSWLNADIETTLRAKLKEYAQELQVVKDSLKDL